MRRFAIGGVFVAIALGLLSRKVPLGVSVWDKSLGDVVYAVMVGFIVLVVKPTLRWRAVGACTFAICFAIECFQLTRLPDRIPRLLRFIIGSRFSWHDVACYAVGAIVVAAITRARVR